MASDYAVQIVHVPSETVVATWIPREGYESIPAEIALRATSKGVGLGRSTRHVYEDIRDAVQEFLMALHKQV